MGKKVAPQDYYYEEYYYQPMPKRVKRSIRKLTESSWLAQSISDMMMVESDARGFTPRWLCLQTLKYIVNEADDKCNPTIYYQNTRGDLEIVVRNIPSLTQYGSDFTRAKMRNKLRGIAERYKDDNGNYTVLVNTTHDLNSALINVSKLMYQIRSH